MAVIAGREATAKDMAHGNHSEAAAAGHSSDPGCMGAPMDATRFCEAEGAAETAGLLELPGGVARLKRGAVFDEEPLADGQQTARLLW